MLVVAEAAVVVVLVLVLVLVLVAVGWPERVDKCDEAAGEGNQRHGPLTDMIFSWILLHVSTTAD